MLKLMDKKIFTILSSKVMFNSTYALHLQDIPINAIVNQYPMT